PLADAVRNAPEHEARLAVAPDVPYRTLMEVLFTLGQCEIPKFHFLVDGPKGMSTIDVVAPRRETEIGPDVMSRSSRRRTTLNPSVMAVSDGISIKTAIGNIGLGCNGVS